MKGSSDIFIILALYHNSQFHDRKPNSIGGTDMGGKAGHYSDICAWVYITKKVNI